MKILFATNNPAKVKRYSKDLEEAGVEIQTLKDLQINLEVNETGKDVEENAILKAKAYYEKTNLPTIALDDGLYIDGLSKEEQIGTHIRRRNGQYLDDNEMIAYYTNLVRKLGGKARARYVKCFAICTKNGIHTYESKTNDFYFVDKPVREINPGYPLDSIFMKILNTDEESKNKLEDDKKIVEFIKAYTKN